MHRRRLTQKPPATTRTAPLHMQMHTRWVEFLDCKSLEPLVVLLMVLLFPNTGCI